MESIRRINLGGVQFIPAAPTFAYLSTYLSWGKPCLNDQQANNQDYFTRMGIKRKETYPD
jgi:hypothetical protein